MFLLEIRCTCTEGTFSNKYCRSELWFLIPLLISTPTIAFVLCGLSIFCFKKLNPSQIILGSSNPDVSLTARLSRDSRLLLYMSITAQDKLLVHKMLLPLLSGFINRPIFRGHFTLDQIQRVSEKLLGLLARDLFCRPDVLSVNQPTVLKA